MAAFGEGAVFGMDEEVDRGTLRPGRLFEADPRAREDWVGSRVGMSPVDCVLLNDCASMAGASDIASGE